MKSKVCLLNLPTPNGRKFTRNIGCAAESKGNYLLQPIDFMHLSGVLAEDYDVHWTDGLAEDLTFDEIKDILRKNDPDIIVVAIIDALFSHDLSLYLELRKAFPDKRFYVFGDAFIEDSNAAKVEDYCDGIIVAPFAIEAKDFLSFDKIGRPGFRTPTFYKDVIKKPTKFSIGIPQHSLFTKGFYKWPFARFEKYTSVTTAWGCPFACSYCTASSFPFHYREYGEVLKELHSIKALGIREVWFTDLSFGFPQENIQNLLKNMIQEKLNFSWSAYFHPMAFNRNLLDLMRKAGCHTIIIGVETKNLELLKNYQRTVTETKILELIKHCKKIGIKVCGDFLIGLTEQTSEEVRNSIDYSKELKLDYASFNLVAPLPGTVIRKVAEERGLVDAGHGIDSLGRGNILTIGKLEKDELLKFRNSALRAFYLRPQFLIKHLLSIRSWEHFWIQFRDFIQLFFKAYK